MLISTYAVFDLFCAATIGYVLRPSGWSYERNLKYTLLRSIVQNDLYELFVKCALRQRVEVF
jgi:hypothetical protein